MCLFIDKSTKRKQLKRSMIVYKTMRLLSDGRLESPYQAHPYELGKTVRSKLKRERCDAMFTFDKVGEGLHAYTELAPAVALADKLADASIARGKHVVVKCRIPKGAYYYTGAAMRIDARRFQHSKQVATDKLIPLEAVEKPQ